MKGISRTEMMSRLGLVKIVEPMIEAAYAADEERMWREDADRSPHGHHWSTSFHASSFPSDDPYACPRQALYTMINVPPAGPVDRRGRSFMDAGKNLELELQRRFGRAGWLLSNDQTAGQEFQTGFVDSFSWLTGNPDLIVVPPGWSRGHVVEVKGKAVRRPPRYRELIDPVAEMQALREQPTPKHEKQLGAYIGMANLEFHVRYPQIWVCEHTWRVCGTDGSSVPSCPDHGKACLRRLDMEPVRDGTLIYIALDDQTVTHEYRYSLDRRAFDAGRARLARWKEHFVAGELPARPDDWMWSKEPYPCRFCPFKKEACKPDDKAGVDRLEDSHAVAYSKKIRPDYDYQEQHARVLARWENNDPTEVTDG